MTVTLANRPGAWLGHARSRGGSDWLHLQARPQDHKHAPVVLVALWGATVQVQQTLRQARRQLTYVECVPNGTIYYGSVRCDMCYLR